ncbi:MAG: tRNA-specific adenosine deaminase subunit tad3 [Trichoglossum hirsutum]|nr:MAG: tRNA-specific adenosine deaminase subunit tad3 [Trichoglossum hirsutum]
MVDVYIVDIPAKCANELLKDLRNYFPDLDRINLQHLRRFVKPEFLPAHLRRLEPRNAVSPNIDYRADNSNSHISHTSPDRDCGSFSEEDDSRHTILSMLVSPTRSISHQSLTDRLSAFSPFLGSKGPPIVRVIPVPLLPPSTAEQAEKWSRNYWPAIYKCSNPYGPHPSIVSRAGQDLARKAGHFMSVAVNAGEQTKARGLGDAVGAVIVDGTADDSGSFAIAAGDARWCHSTTGLAGCKGNGNVMGHAVMRAIGMVARKRLHSTSEPKYVAPKDGEAINPSIHQDIEALTDTFLERPITPIEEAYYRQASISGDGYLCVGLTIYTTHEPCIMCSMAILHSRFRGVVFGQRMVRTGGLTAEEADQPPGNNYSDRSSEGEPQELFHTEMGGLGYGMFWRDELNWKLLAWQWNDEGQSSIPQVDQNTHA